MTTTNDKTQHERFKDAARELDCDEDEARFDEKLKRVAKAKPEKDAAVYHHMSAKHLHRYVAEFAGRHNVREEDTMKQMEAVVTGMVWKRLMYTDLTS